MTVTDRNDTAATDLSSKALLSSRLGPRRGLNQPWRAIVAGVEVLLAGGAVWLAFVVWGSGVQTVRGITDAPVTRYHGDLIFLAIVLGAAAVVLVIDAIRQLVLAIGARSKRPGVSDEPFVDSFEDTDLD